MTYYIIRTSFDDIQLIDVLPELGPPQGGCKEILYEGYELPPEFEPQRLGGYTSIDGKLIYSEQLRLDRENKIKETIEASKPLAQGTDIIVAAQNLFNAQHVLIRGVLLAKFDYIVLTDKIINNLKSYLQQNNKDLQLTDLMSTLVNQPFSLLKFLSSATCNPLRKSDFDFVLLLLKAIDDPIIKDSIKVKYFELAKHYADKVRFAPELPAEQNLFIPPPPPPSPAEAIKKITK